jgi:putative tricarboxylic transport membrane protein
MLIMIAFGVIGYLMKKFEYEAAPMVLAYVLGPMLEMALRQSLAMSNGNFSIFMTRPLSAVVIAAAILLVASPLLPWVGQHRMKMTEEIRDD